MEDYNIFMDVKTIIFDFDNTLVDFDTNSKKALFAVAKDMYDYFNEIGSSPNFNDIYSALLTVSAKLDEEGIYDRNKWWEESLKSLGLKASKDQFYEWTTLYWSIASYNPPYKDSIELLEYLKEKKYKLVILSNSDGEGGDKKKRIENSSLSSYFDAIIIAGENGIKPKPSLQAFILACEQFSGVPSSCLMVGDDPVKDCLGAKKAGLKSVLVDREGKIKFAELYADYVVRNLTELEEFF
ncbi:HAD-IA family hydrolase [Acidianus sulfidivorans JP7]|uniref:2-haloalkanoic acid dehalogenase n=1 Tax=Acidianus sulfidivorans JP7 TaxID=619593 RepID=A0A2U9IMJ0_9CREN|nr:HAD family hydrolase [Acidianus sulfidivorans]AWR97279.1 HAD-IA family hydrolase [Acidianus sulfidivorans JP7]